MKTNLLNNTTFTTLVNETFDSMQEGDSITCAEVAALVGEAMPNVAITRIKLGVTALVKSNPLVKSVQRKGIVKLAAPAVVPEAEAGEPETVVEPEAVSVEPETVSDELETVVDLTEDIEFETEASNSQSDVDEESAVAV